MYFNLFCGVKFSKGGNFLLLGNLVLGFFSLLKKVWVYVFNGEILVEGVYFRRRLIS